MKQNKDKSITNDSNGVELVSEDEVRATVGDVVASLMLNPLVSWAKFILTDDTPNGNKMRIPVSEFDNIIKSGLHMPVKMAQGKIEEDHSNAEPIGVITHLKKEIVDGVNQIVGLAALWLKERPSDVQYLRSLMDSGKDINLSWEISVGERRASAGGVIDLIGVVMNAATIVGRPAYEGRTRFIAMAAKNRDWGKAYIESLPDSSFLYIEKGGELDSEGRTFPRELRHFPIKDDKGLIVASRLKEVLTEADQSELPLSISGDYKLVVATLLEKLEAGVSLEELSSSTITAPLKNKNTEEDNVELEQLKQRVSELEAALEATKNALKEKTDALATVTTEKSSLETEKQATAEELENLRQFKVGIEASNAKVEKLASIKAKFEEAGLVKDEAYFTTNEEKLLGMDEGALEFMIQELSAFAKDDKEEATLKDGKRVPNLHSENTGTFTIPEIAEGMKEVFGKAKKAK